VPTSDRSRPSSVGPTLTPRQSQAVLLARDGASPPEIAAALGISKRSANRLLAQARGRGVSTAPPAPAVPAEPRRRPPQSARTGQIQKPRKPHGYARVYLTDSKEGLLRVKGVGAALEREHDPAYELGDYGNPMQSGRRMQLVGQSIADIGSHSALDAYSAQEVAERQARARGATHQIAISEDGSYVVTDL
jgi:DNA-binding CsgD family transcriptional regulator